MVMISTVVLFWLFLTIVAVSVTWSGYLSRRAAEKTIRYAIDKGMLVDPELIARLRGNPRPRWDVRMIIAGIVVAFVGMGVCVFAVLLAFDSFDALFPVLSIGAGVLLPGVGLIVGGVWLRRLEREEPGRD
jgi:hypothetical protein